MNFQEPRAFLVGELADLVSIKDIRCAITGQGLLDRLGVEVGGQDIGATPRQNSAARPVYHGEQIDEPSFHQYAGDIHCPRVMGTDDRQIAQPVGIAPISRISIRIINGAHPTLRPFLRNRLLSLLAPAPANG